MATDNVLSVPRGVPRRGARVPHVVGYVFAVVCLLWVLRDVQFEAMWENVRRLRWELVMLAVAVDVVSYATQGLRWRLLLRPLGRLSWVEATQAIYAGLFASEVLPMRPGELLRAYAVARRLKADVVDVLPSIMVERLFDGVWLAAGIGLTAMFVPLPRDLLRAGDVLGLVILLATGLFVGIVLSGTGTRSIDGTIVHSKRGRTLASWLRQLRAGVRQIGFGRETYLACGLSLLLLVGQVLAFWLVMRAYRLDVSLWVGAATLIIVHLGTAIPNAPANVGTYQFFCVVGLLLFGVDKSVAGEFSMVVFLVLTAPLWALGSVALARTGVTLSALRAGGPASRHGGRS